MITEAHSIGPTSDVPELACLSSSRPVFGHPNSTFEWLHIGDLKPVMEVSFPTRESSWHLKLFVPRSTALPSLPHPLMRSSDASSSHGPPIREQFKHLAESVTGESGCQPQTTPQDARPGRAAQTWFYGTCSGSAPS